MELRLYTSIFEQPLLCELLDKQHRMPRKVIDPLREEIRNLFFGSVFRSDEGDGSDERQRLLKRCDLAVLILQALELVSMVGGSMPHGRNTGDGHKTSKGEKKPWAASEVADWNVLLQNPSGLDASTIVDTAYHVLGRTPQQIHDAIPSQWRVHIESIMRSDLAARFLNYQAQLREHLQQKVPAQRLRECLSLHSQLEGQVRARIAKKELVDDMITPRVTFHGTRLEHVGSIIRHGFKLPGSRVDRKLVASPRSGIAFRRGIYSSQASWYAMSYASGQSQQTPLGEIPSMRLFVCATVMGRTYRDPRTPFSGSVHGPLVDGYDSHFDGRFEYIVHDERAMLPCYVVHLDLGSEAAKKALRHAQENPWHFHTTNTSHQKKTDPRLMTGAEGERMKSPGDIQREKAARKAAAMKWFPYGFGTATGTNFVIEEVGELSDDEEDYGDWQADKHAFVRRDDDTQADEEDMYCDDYDDDGNLVKRKLGAFLDQYQGARFAPVKRIPEKKVEPDAE
ncbi:hypothetical protein QBC46DRAFT_379887 [Diplogelasinospora grovesii]|uniref:PARP catalytic domain-containing protein n=1 Tax=Diplogelasinospora grovesii TaxID=303347 RepID=A0AAN6NB86_9PEZI|nr:hypothetical protein QBC46DRAFT_379887 [Diplogelasinospora grovesii]